MPGSSFPSGEWTPSSPHATLLHHPALWSQSSAASTCWKDEGHRAVLPIHQTRWCGSLKRWKHLNSSGSFQRFLPLPSQGHPHRRAPGSAAGHVTPAGYLNAAGERLPFSLPRDRAGTGPLELLGESCAGLGLGTAVPVPAGPCRAREVAAVPRRRALSRPRDARCSAGSALVSSGVSQRQQCERLSRDDWGFVIAASWQCLGSVGRVAQEQYCAYG